MKCKICGSNLTEKDEKCPFCGCDNEFYEKRKLNCPVCGQTIDENQTTCNSCGCELKKNTLSVKYCNNCGTKLAPTANYCYRCGCTSFKASNDTIDETLEETNLTEVNEIEYHRIKKISLIGILTYFGIFYLVSPLVSQILLAIIVKAYNVDLTLVTTTEDLLNYYPNAYAMLLALANLFTYGLLFCSVFVIMFKLLKADLVNLRGHMSTFWSNFGITLGLLYASSILSNIVLNLILIITGLSKYDTGNSANQEAINLILTASPITCIITLLMTIFAAPIIEELVFRKGFFNMSKNKGKKVVIISGLIFGAIHIVDAVASGIIGVIENTTEIQTVIVEFLYIISYASSGIVLGYCYHRAKYNVSSNILAHMAYNAIGIILTLLTFLLN